MYKAGRFRNAEYYLFSRRCVRDILPVPSAAKDNLEVRNTIISGDFNKKVSNEPLSRKISMWPQHFWPLNCPTLRSVQFKGNKCLARIEIPLENKPINSQ